MMLQLNPPLEIETPKGSGWIQFVIDYSLEGDLYWVVWLDSGQIWTFANHEVRAPKNITIGRREPEKP